MKKLAFASALSPNILASSVLSVCFALALSGCAQFDSFASTLASPRTTQAVANLQAGTRALVCAVSSAAAVADRVEAAVSAGQALVGTTGKIYVASGVVCDALGGTVAGRGVAK